MKIISTASALTLALDAERASGRSIGFVPTMGALHEGHAALVRQCAADQGVTVASVFVNPTQFNDGADLEAYPRTPEADTELLRACGCHYLYLPAVEDVYPGGMQHNPVSHLEFGSLTTRMEGSSRPGHFAGVVQVVSRLLDIVRPAALYLGQKDYQQVAVVRRMVELLALDVRVIGVPTVRETDGLAMSSRNRRLRPDERRAAGRINQHLAVVAAALRAGWPARELERLAMKGMRDHPLLSPEYVEVVDGDTLLPYQDGDPVRELVVATAVRVGAIRLIDNRIARCANP